MKSAVLAWVFLSLTHATAFAQFLADANAFAGTPNTYSPSVMYDAQDRVFKMWYGGWQVAGQTNDEIYYRTSPNAIDWSAPVTVLTPTLVSQQYQQATAIAIPITHVNDPSVTKIFNTAMGAYQYTMFFTACEYGCALYPSQTQETIWSAVSGDGITWSFAQPVGNIVIPGIASGSTAPFSASSVVDASGTTNTVWHLYFGNYGPGSNAVYEVNVDGNRQAVSQAQTVFATPDGSQAVNPEVFRIGEVWYLFYNTNNANGSYDIAAAASLSDMSWTSASARLLVAAHAPYCGLLTPGAVAFNETVVGLYFSAIKFDNGACPGDQNQEIDMFAFRAP